MAAAVKADNNMMNAMDPNLKPYFDRGGKILQYHGWADQQMTPGNSPKYYKSVLEKLGGASKVMDNYRLFMVPGMGHCGGGDGTDTFDKRAVLEQWVEQKKAPDQIIASHMSRRRGDTHAAAVPVSAGRGLQGSGEHRRCREFLLQGEVASSRLVKRSSLLACDGGEFALLSID